LALLSLMVAASIRVSLEPPKLSKGTGPKDVDLYYAVAQRLHAGENYYDALGGELRSRGYPTRSVFNWRTPLHLELLAHLPSLGWARVLLALGAICAMVLSAVPLCRDRRYGFAVVQLLLLCVPFGITGMSNTFLFAEVWAGVLIAMSVGWYALGWRYAGAATGLLSLFFRELALPYAVIGAFLAYREGRKRELFFWLAGIGGYLIFLGLHAMAVLSRIPPAGVAPAMARWIQFGGLPFVITTSRIGLLLAFPYWVAALYVPVAVFGLVGWPSRVAFRVLATVGTYMLAFSVVGAPSINFYWGAVYNPLLAFGAAWAVPAFRDIGRLALAPGQTQRLQPSGPATSGSAA
jgi:hypothetical protein